MFGRARSVRNTGRGDKDRGIPVRTGPCPVKLKFIFSAGDTQFGRSVGNDSGFQKRTKTGAKYGACGERHTKTAVSQGPSSTRYVRMERIVINEPENIEGCEALESSDFVRRSRSR